MTKSVSARHKYNSFDLLKYKKLSSKDFQVIFSLNNNGSLFGTN